MSKTNMLVLFGAAIIVDYVNVTQIAEASSKFPDNFGGNETRTIEGIEVQVRKVEKLSIDIHGSSQTNSPRSSGVPLSPAATTPLQSPMSSPIASNSPKPKSLTPKAMGNRKTQLEKKTADYKELSTNLKALVAEKIRLKQIIEENNSRIEQINKDLQNKEVKTDKNKLIRGKKSLEKVSSDNIEKMENINTSLMQIEDDMLKVRTEIKTLKLQIEEAQNAITDSGAIMFQKPTSSYDAPLSYYLRGNSSSSFENIASEPEDLEKKQQEQQDEEKKFQDLKQKTEQGLSDFDSNRLELQEYLSDPRGEIDEKISEEEARVRTETDDVMKTWKIGENYKNIDKINEETQKIMRTFNCKVSTVYEELCDFKNAKLEELKDMSTKKEKVSKALSDIIKARKNESNLKELNRLLLNIFYKTKQIYKNLTTIKGQLDAKLKEFGKAGDDAIKSINSFVTAMFAPSEERLNYIIDWKEQAGVNKTGALASEMMRNEDLELVVLHRLEMMLRGHSHCNTTVKMLNESLSKLEGLREYQAKNAKPRSEKAAEGVMEEEEEEEGEHIEEGDGGDNNA